MGVTERKERERQEMRQRILDAAQQVFVEEGYEKASIRNIAERIEYSPATIYLYFKILGVSFPEIKTKSTHKIGMRFDGENRNWVIIINQKPL